MKFDDWTNALGYIPAGGNIQFYSVQSTNAIDEAHAVPITASSTLSAPMYLNPNEDLDVSQGGRQIQIVVETQVPAGAAGGSYSTSYGITTNPPAPATITVSNLTQTYDSTAKSVTVTTNPSGLANSVTYNGSALLPISAGPYTILATVTDPNYTGTSTASMVINPAAVTVTANQQTKVYDGLTSTDPALTYTATPSLFDSDTFTGALTRNAGEQVGTYNITQGTLALDGNYSPTFVPSTFTITASTSEVSLSNLSQTYGSTGAVTVTTFPVGLSNTVTYNGSATIPTAAGTYAVVATVNDPNYVGTATGSLVISPLPLTVTATTDTKTYDGTTSSSKVPTITSGALVNGDTATWTQTFATKNVGGEINLIPTGTISDNYNVTYVDAVGSITPASVSVTASNGTMVYGGTVPTITPTYSPVITPATPATCSTAATVSSPVGSYASSCTGAADQNYIFTYIVLAAQLM